MAHTYRRSFYEEQETRTKKPYRRSVIKRLELETL